MKKVLCMFVVFLAAMTSVFANGQQEGESGSEDKVYLTMGSWRTDDVAQIKAVLGEFTKQYPHIEVVFQPTIPQDYNTTLRLQLESGTGPDVMYARSFINGVNLFNDGHFVDISDLKGYDENYSDANKSPWQTPEGNAFGIPFIAVSHGIYFNKDIFKELNLSAPKDWDEFLVLCQTVKDAGYIPLANGLADQWDINEVVLMNIAPNFIGGREGRLAFDSGEKKFNGPEVVKLYEAMLSLEPFLPAGYTGIGYNDSQALFATGQAAMFFDGSWTISAYDGVDFEWGVLPPPPPKGVTEENICFHADAGMGINAASEHIEEAKLLLEWFGSKEGADALAKYLPTGMFPMSKNAVSIDNSHANNFLKLNEGRGTDVRWVWPNLLDGEPSGYLLMQENSIGVITGEMTPQEAADRLRNGLAEWYPPAQ